MAAGIVVAVLLHAAIVVATLFSWMHKLDIADETPPVVPVDLVSIADQNNIAPTAPRIEPKQDVQLPPPSEPLPEPTPPAPDEAAPEPVPSQPVVPKPPPLPKPMMKPQEAMPAPAKPKPKDADINDLVNGILNAKPARNSNTRVANRTVKGIGQMNAATVDLSTALRGMVKPCWHPPPLPPNPDDLVVDFDLFLTPDGRVAQPPQLTADSQSRLGNTYTRAAAEAVRRAIYTCQPYKLPADRYEQWREINPFHFDPRQMMGEQ